MYIVYTDQQHDRKKIYVYFITNLLYKEMPISMRHLQLFSAVSTCQQFQLNQYLRISKSFTIVALYVNKNLISSCVSCSSTRLVPLVEKAHVRKEE